MTGTLSSLSSTDELARPILLEQQTALLTSAPAYVTMRTNHRVGQLRDENGGTQNDRDHGPAIRCTPGALGVRPADGARADGAPAAGRQPALYHCARALAGNGEGRARRSREEAQTHRFRPTLTEREATTNLLSDFLHRFFHGSAERMVLGLVDARKLDPQSLKVIEARLAAAPAHPQDVDGPKLTSRSKRRGRTS